MISAQQAELAEGEGEDGEVASREVMFIRGWQPDTAPAGLAAAAHEPMPPPPRDPVVGSLLAGRFRVTGTLGEGAFGKLCRGWDLLRGSGLGGACVATNAGVCVACGAGKVYVVEDSHRDDRLRALKYCAEDEEFCQDRDYKTLQQLKGRQANEGNRHIMCLCVCVCVCVSGIHGIAHSYGTFPPTNE